jgi:hypothetical protein
MATLTARAFRAALLLRNESRNQLLQHQSAIVLILRVWALPRSRRFDGGFASRVCLTLEGCELARGICEVSGEVLRGVLVVSWLTYALRVRT